MISKDNVEEAIKKKLSFTASIKLHNRMLNDVLNAQNKSKKTTSAATGSRIRRTIMKSPITKLAAAAVIITAITLGLFEFIGTGSSSGVVWAEVARKVQASRGVIFRSKEISQDSRDNEPDYTMNYLSNTHSRLDSYKEDQIFKTIYDDYNTKTVILVDHLPSHKSYVKMTFDEKIQQSNFLTNPKSMVQRFLSCEHRELGPKTFEGMLCEGFETTDPAFDETGPDYPTDSVTARIWVSVETGYPVQFECEIVRKNGEIRIGGVRDQFQWDVELDESMFEPNIPADYIDISPY
jgi:outer membrane lipoprotein-sorting protein